MARKLTLACVALFALCFSGCALDYQFRPLTPDEVFRDTQSDWIVQKYPETGCYGPMFEIVSAESSKKRR